MNDKFYSNANIVTKLPHKKDVELLDKINQYEANSMQGQIPLVWDKAHGFIVEDRHGNRFIDFTSGICVANCGHGNPEIADAIAKQTSKPLLHSYTFGTEIRYKFLKELVDTCYPNGKAFLVSAGTEATEVACKLMKMYNKRTMLMSFTGAMHGRTSLAEQLKGDYTWAVNDNHVWHFSFPKPEETWEDIIRFVNTHFIDNCAGIIIESYQGWSAQFYPKQYIKDLVKWAKQRKILVCFDEIQGGFGRTGRMFAYEHYGIDKPDLICFGKGISSSVPLSGVMGKKDILDTPKVGSMSSTHSANPISCAAGLANLRYILDNNLIERSEELGHIMFDYLENKLKLRVEGHGLLCAIHTETEKEADRIVMECFKKGLLLIRTHRKSVKLAPPLVITPEALIEGLKIIESVIKKR